MATWAGRPKGSAESLWRVPLDASQVDNKPEQSIGVALKYEAGTRSEDGHVNETGTATTFRVPRKPESVRAVVGPSDESDHELTCLQTLRVGVSWEQPPWERSIWFTGESGQRPLGLAGVGSASLQDGCSG